MKKHGIGKGLMTVWRVTNPNGGDFPTGIHFDGSELTEVPQISTPVSWKQPRQKKKRRQPVSSLLVSNLICILHDVLFLLMNNQSWVHVGIYMWHFYLSYFHFGDTVLHFQKQRMLQNKLLEKKKPSVKRKQVIVFVVPLLHWCS